LFGIRSRDEFKKTYQGWAAEALGKENWREREGRWTESIAVGNEGFVRDMKEKLGPGAMWREVAGGNGSYELREATAVSEAVSGSQNHGLRLRNTFFGDISI